MKKLVLFAVSCIAFISIQGCATNIARPSQAPRPAKEKFGNFENVILKDVSIAPAYASSGANKKAAKKINELLKQRMNVILPNINSGKKDGRTLVIDPQIKEIKFIGGAARFCVGALAGSSAVLMEVTYLDQETGTVLARPEFYSQAAAMAGNWSVGATDNLMLDRIVNRIGDYTSANR